MTTEARDILDWLADKQVGVGCGLTGGVDESARIFTIISRHHFTQSQTGPFR